MSLKEWLNERPGAKLDEAESVQHAAESERLPASFDPHTQVSADAKYIVKNLVLWFLVLPALVGLILWAVTR